jgi:hypothetical protein
LKNHFQTYKWFYNYLAFEPIKEKEIIKKKEEESQKENGEKLGRLDYQKSIDIKVMKY